VRCITSLTATSSPVYVFAPKKIELSMTIEKKEFN